MTTFRLSLLTSASLLAASLASGCANLSTVFREFSLESGKSVTVDAQQRAILVNRVYDESGVQRFVYCAEPSPDSLFAIGASFGGGGNVALASGAKGDADVAQALVSAASDALSARNATIQLLRDGLYRACEAFASGALTRLEYAEVTWRYQKMVLAALSIELVANLNRPRREPSVTGAGASASANGNAMYKGSPDAMQKGTPARAPDDDKSTPADLRGIATAFSAGVQAGTAAAKAGTPPVPPYSDAAIERISGTAMGLVESVLRSEDRVTQCLRYLALVEGQERERKKKDITSTVEAMCGRLLQEATRPALAADGSEAPKREVSASSSSP